MVCAGKGRGQFRQNILNHTIQVFQNILMGNSNHPNMYFLFRPTCSFLILYGSIRMHISIDLDAQLGLYT